MGKITGFLEYERENGKARLQKFMGGGKQGYQIAFLE